MVKIHTHKCSTSQDQTPPEGRISDAVWRAGPHPGAALPCSAVPGASPRAREGPAWGQRPRRSLPNAQRLA